MCSAYVFYVWLKRNKIPIRNPVLDGNNPGVRPRQAQRQPHQKMTSHGSNHVDRRQKTSLFLLSVIFFPFLMGDAISAAVQQTKMPGEHILLNAISFCLDKILPSNLDTPHFRIVSTDILEGYCNEQVRYVCPDCIMKYRTV
jgi:hypothetical protein